MGIKETQDFVSKKMVSGQTDKMFVLATVIDEYLYNVVPLLFLQEDLLPVFKDIVTVQHKLTNLRASI